MILDRKTWQGLLLLAAALWLHSAGHRPEASDSVIVQASSVEEAAFVVGRFGGEVTHTLGVLEAVAARLPAAAVERLRHEPRIRRVWENQRARVASEIKSSSIPYSEFPRLVDADWAHEKGITGHGVTVAVIDSGLLDHQAIVKNTLNERRVLACYDAVRNRDVSNKKTNDENGHGGHILGVIAGNHSSNGKYQGIAPDVDLVVVRAFDEDGVGTYADVIRGLDWVLRQRDAYGIRIVNLSFSAQPRSHYWDDPLGRAVMRLWQAGIVVVTAAGNGGPGPMTIGVPGNVPYVITAGAMTDSFTPDNRKDDRLISFSAAGPTFEGFLKPDLVAPGGHLASLVGPQTTLAWDYYEHFVSGLYFQMSGTSQATAVVTGVAALALQADPTLTPDELKCRLLAASQPAVDASGQLAYSVFQQGAGLVSARRAIDGRQLDCANLGLDIDQDLNGATHFAGPARLDENYHFVLGDLGYSWDGSYDPDQGYLWNGGTPWQEASVWTGGNPWVDIVGNPWVDIVGNPWVDIVGNPWVDIVGNPWVDIVDWWDDEDSDGEYDEEVEFSDDLSETMAITWVGQE